MTSTFAQLGVPDQICATLASRGITDPFEIQAATIADTFAGRDVCGRAPTGSGKTLAFGIPLVATVDRATPRRPRALVLVPTRELADQINTELSTFSGPIRLGVVYGGVGYGPQTRSLRAGIDILVACPGRLEDLMAQGEVDLCDVDKVVVDEADRMADMGFLPAVRRILDRTSNDRQTLLFSATLDGDVAKLTRDYQSNPVRHEVGNETPDITAARHVFWKVARNERVTAAAGAVDAAWPAIVFCRTRHGSDRLARQLGKSGITAVAIHGGRSQPQRTRALADFSNGRVHALVATDVAARGIHVDGVASVIHYDPAEDHKAYVHRSGRTARAGLGGVVVSLVQPEQVKDLRQIQRHLGLDEPFIDPDAIALRDADSISTGPDTRPRPQGPTSAEPSGSGPRGRSANRPSRGNKNRSNRSYQPRSGPGRGRKSGAGKASSGDARGSGSSSGGRGSSGSKPTGSGKPSGNGKPKGRFKGTSKPNGRGNPKNRAKGNTGARSGGAGASRGGPNRKARRAHLQRSDQS